MSKNDQALYMKLLEMENKLDQLLHHETTKPIQVKLLHQYNDIKDATQIIINHIANIEGTSVSEIHKRRAFASTSATALVRAALYEVRCPMHYVTFGDSSRRPWGMSRLSSQVLIMFLV
ncbi:unnamed protein product, partial [Brenthis ino]